MLELVKFSAFRRVSGMLVIAILVEHVPLEEVLFQNQQDW